MGGVSGVNEVRFMNIVSAREQYHVEYVSRDRALVSSRADPRRKSWQRAPSTPVFAPSGSLSLTPRSYQLVIPTRLLVPPLATRALLALNRAIGGAYQPLPRVTYGHYHLCQCLVLWHQGAGIKPALRS